MEARVESLIARVERLEVENRRLKRGGVAVLAIAAVGALASASAAVCKTVWAERFVLNDSGGRERAVLTAYETGGKPVLSLFDERGKPSIAFGVAEDGRAYVELPGKDGVVRSHFAVSAEGHATIAKADVAAAR
jgi:hypothetical protein